MRRTGMILLILLLVVLVLLLAGCGTVAEEQDITPESEPVTVSPVSKTISGEELVSWTAYANWSDDGSIISGSLNGMRMLESSVRHIPVFLIRSRTELEAFRKTYGGLLTMDKGYQGFPSFNETVSGCDEAFFSERSLMIAYESTSSGSFHFRVSKVVIDGAEAYMVVEQTNNPQTFTCDMSGWFLMAELKNDDIAGCTDYDAWLAEQKLPQAALTVGHIPFGTFSWNQTERMLAEMDEAMRKRVRTEGFVNTEPEESFDPVRRAMQEAGTEFEFAQTLYDAEEDCWMVRLFHSETEGEMLEIYMSGDGVTRLIIRAEQGLYGGKTMLPIQYLPQISPDPDATAPEIAEADIAYADLPEMKEQAYRYTETLTPFVSYLRDRMGVDPDERWHVFVHWYDTEQKTGMVEFRYFIGTIGTDRCVIFHLDQGTCRTVWYRYLDRIADEASLIRRVMLFQDRYYQEKKKLELDETFEGEQVNYAYYFGTDMLAYSYQLFYSYGEYGVINNDYGTCCFIDKNGMAVLPSSAES